MTFIGHQTNNLTFQLLEGGGRMSGDSIAAQIDLENELVAQEETFDLHALDQILEKYKGQKGVIIPILQEIQDVYGYLPKKILVITSKKTRIPISTLYGVATFYAQFHLAKRGKHLIRICDGTACHVSGSTKIVQAIENAFDMESGGSSPDYKYTLEIVYCVGSCGLAPVAVVGDKVFAKTKPESFVRTLKKLE
jgi:NADH:ubiquinone oxidoreductase subunit E